MARKESKSTSFADLVARLKDMSNMTPEQERSELMEAANNEPKVLDDKDISLADIAKLAGIKEYTESPKVSEKAEKLVEAITKEEEPKTESDITKAIKESDADDSISANIKRAVTEERKRLEYEESAKLKEQQRNLKEKEEENLKKEKERRLKAEEKRRLNEEVIRKIKEDEKKMRSRREKEEKKRRSEEQKKRRREEEKKAKKKDKIIMIKKKKKE